MRRWLVIFALARIMWAWAQMARWDNKSEDHWAAKARAGGYAVDEYQYGDANRSWRKETYVK